MNNKNDNPTSAGNSPENNNNQIQIFFLAPNFFQMREEGEKNKLPEAKHLI